MRPVAPTSRFFQGVGFLPAGNVCIEYLSPGSPLSNPTYEGRDEKFNQIRLESLSVPDNLCRQSLQKVNQVRLVMLRKLKKGLILVDNVPVQRRRYAVRWNRFLDDRLSPPYRKSSRTLMLRSGEVEAIKVHHFVPGRDEVVDKLLPRVGTSVEFRQGAELGVRTKD